VLEFGALQPVQTTDIGASLAQRHAHGNPRSRAPWAGRPGLKITVPVGSVKDHPCDRTAAPDQIGKVLPVPVPDSATRID